MAKLKCSCETRQGFFFLITLLDSPCFQPYFRFPASVGQDRIKVLLKSWKLSVYSANVASDVTRGCTGLFPGPRRANGEAAPVNQRPLRP